MKDIFMNVINSGDYDLTALLAKVDTYHIEGKLTDAERDEIYTEARKTPIASYDFAAEIESIWKAIRELQGNVNKEVVEFVQPSGAHDAYQIGDKVIYNGNTYECVIANCVWSPDVLPSAWKLV